MRKTAIILSVLVLAVSCNRNNPFDSYYHGGVEREETGGKPGKGGLFADGFGTEESPYGLSTPQHMQNIPRGLVEGEMVYFRMLNDIDLDGISWTALNPSDPYKKFIDFDGGGHVILNLYCPKQNYGSFFGVLCGSCHDVGFLNAYTESSGAGGIIGGYVGLASPSDGDFTGRVERVYVTGTVRGGGSTGGICGELGKIADATPCVISECYSLAEVNGTGSTGGLVGNMRQGSRIENSYATGSVTGGSDAKFGAGGIAGSVNGGTIDGCIGWNSEVNVTPTRGGVYGLVGDNGITITDCSFISSLGGTNTTNQGTTVKSQEELQTMAAGWGGGWYANGKISNGYPILIWQQERGDYGDYSGHGSGGGGGGSYEPAFGGGNGTEAEPFLIENLGHLRTMHDTLKLGKDYWFRLMADIDAKTLANWEPLNVEEPYNIKVHFDGNGHKISNLKSNNARYAGFFGVLYGECHDVTFEKCSVSQNTGYVCGILGGYAGTGEKKATLTNVSLVNCSVTSTGAAPCGGMFGMAANADFVNCSAEGTSVESGNASTDSSKHGYGGIAGQIKGSVTFLRCSFDGSVKGARLVGGIAGYVNCAGSFTGCHNSGEITSYQVTTSVDGARAGGIAGHVNAGTQIYGCSNSGTINATKQAGGIVAWVEDNNTNVVISRCYSTGNIKAGQWPGGIVGYMKAGEINNCWSSGAITLNSGGQIAGGIVAEIKSGYLSDTYPATKGFVTNCWSKATLSGPRVLGGIAGRCAHDGWLATTTDSKKTADITITGCIAWNPSIQSPATEQNQGSSGAIVGYSYIKNNLSKCWRSPDMNFVTYVDNTLVDMADVSPSAPLSKTGSGENCYPWHGKAASATATPTSIAISLDWSDDIWDLSGNEPTLK